MRMNDRMTQGLRVGLVLLMGASLAGCRASVQTVQVERIDQGLGGNRGFLVGNAPAAGSRTPTREIAELAVVLPTAKTPATRTAARPLASTMGEPSAAETPEVAPMESSELYTVKKGDTLWSIARQFYGKGSLWPRIYDANREQLSEPGRLRAGMRLVVPPDAAQPTSETTPSEK